MKGEKKNQFKALERIETPCFRKQRHGGRPRCPRATDSWVSCLQWALAPDPCTAKPQQEGAGRASPAQDRVRGWGLGRQRGPRARVGWRKMGCGGEATCTHVPVVETSVNHQYCTSYREGLGTAPRATAGGRWGGPVFTTATSDGPLVHWASYLPSGPAPSGVAGEVRMLFSQQPSAAFPLLVPSQSQSPARAGHPGLVQSQGERHFSVCPDLAGWGSCTSAQSWDRTRVSWVPAG